jgi:O-antigen/teichoic acid export membrane protein
MMKLNNTVTCEEMRAQENIPSSGKADLPEHGHEVLRIFGKNTTWLLLDRAGLKVGAMLAGLVLIGYLGPANMGIYTTAIAVGSVLNVILDLGLTLYAARVVAASPEEAPSILALTLTTTVLASVVELITIAVAYAFGHWYAACICVGLIFTNLEGTSSLCTGILSADLRSQSVLPGSILSTASVVAIIVLVVHYKLSVLTLLVGLAVKSVAVLVLRLVQLRHYWPLTWEYFGYSNFLRLVKTSSAYFSYSLVQGGYEKVTIVCFGLIASHEQVGLLSAAMVIAFIFPSFTYAGSDALLPVMTKLYEANRISDLLELRRRLMNLLLFMCVPVGIVLAVFAPEICQLLGSRYAASAAILRITASRSVLSTLDNFLGQAGLTAVSKVAERRNSQAIGLALCAVLTILFGLYWGAIGAAIALLLTDTFILVRYFRVYARAGLSVGLPGGRSAAIAAVGMVLTSLLLSNLFWGLRAVVSLAVYLAILAIISPRRVVETAHTFRYCFVST